MSHCEDSFRFLTLGRLVIEKLNELSKLLFLRTIDRSFRSVLNMFYLAILLWGALKGTITLQISKKLPTLELGQGKFIHPLEKSVFSVNENVCIRGLLERHANFTDPQTK